MQAIPLQACLSWTSQDPHGPSLRQKGACCLRGMKVPCCKSRIPSCPRSHTAYCLTKPPAYYPTQRALQICSPRPTWPCPVWRLQASRPSPTHCHSWGSCFLPTQPSQQVEQVRLAACARNAIVAIDFPDFSASAAEPSAPEASRVDNRQEVQPVTAALRAIIRPSQKRPCACVSSSASEIACEWPLLIWQRFLQG